MFRQWGFVLQQKQLRVLNPIKVPVVRKTRKMKFIHQKMTDPSNINFVVWNPDPVVWNKLPSPESSPSLYFFLFLSSEITGQIVPETHCYICQCTHRTRITLEAKQGVMLGFAKCPINRSVNSFHCFSIFSWYKLLLWCIVQGISTGSCMQYDTRGITFIFFFLIWFSWWRCYHRNCQSVILSMWAVREFYKN